MENLENRSDLEQKIAIECGCKDFQVLIDIPEKISFESEYQKGTTFVVELTQEIIDKSSTVPSIASLPAAP